MSNLHRVLWSLLVCVVVILFSIAGLASDFVTSLLGSMDGLLMLMISLMMLGIFSVMLLVLAKEAGILPTRKTNGVAVTATPAQPAVRPARTSPADEVQPNQATHPVAHSPARPPAAPATAQPALTPPAKLGEGK